MIGTVGFVQILSPADNSVVTAYPSSPSEQTVLLINEEYTSVEEMNLAFETDGVPEGGYVLINTGNVADEDNAKVFVKRVDGYKLFADLSGAPGANGQAGEQGEAGPAGVTPLLHINEDTGMWEVSYDTGASWSSLGVLAQGPKGDKGETGARGPQGSQGIQGAQGPAYVLTEADKIEIINRVLAQLGGGNGGSGDIGSDTVMFSWDTDSGVFKPCSSPSNAWEYMHTCEQCGAVLFSPNPGEYYCPNTQYCSNIDGYFVTVRNPYSSGTVSNIYHASSADGPWEEGVGDYSCYRYESSCGAILYVQDSIMSYIMSCPHCQESHDVMWEYYS